MKKSGTLFINNLRYLCLIGVIALGLMTVVGTGGGGGGGGDGEAPPPAEPGTIDTSTAPQSASAIGNIAIGLSAGVLPVTLDTGSGAYCPKTLLRHADDLIFNGGKYRGNTSYGSYSGIQPKPSESETVYCSDGGSVTSTVSWDGPDEPEDCSEVQNLRMEFSFANCQEGTETMNGTMGMYFVGDLCTENPTAFGMYFTNLRYQSDSDFIALNLTMDFSGIQYDESGYMVGMNASLDGSMSGTFEGTSVDLNYDNWTLAFSNIKYEYNEMVEMTVTFDGSFSGTIDGDSFNESYDNVVYTYKDTTRDSIPGILFTVDGRYKGACLDGWVTFETIEPIFVPELSECPTSGQIIISGDGEATIVYNSDGSVTINVGGEELYYASCDDLPPCI